MQREAYESGANSIKLRWREGGKAPCEMVRWCDAVSGRNTVYCVNHFIIHAYNTTTSDWSLITKCPIVSGFAVAVINNILTAIGGRDSDMKVTNKLFSLAGTGEDGEQCWTMEFPPMPTARCDVSALCTGTALIVAEGENILSSVVKMVEVLNTSTRQWHTAPELPQLLYFSAMTVCGDRIYVLGGCGEDDKWTNSVYFCSLTALLPSVLSRLVRALSIAVSLHGQLIAVGGEGLDDQPTSDIHRYNSSTNSWEVISHMATPRAGCLAAVLPDNQLMVVGGLIKGSKYTNSVEFGAACN